MARSFDASNLISLPRLDAAGALALGSQLLAAADRQKALPKDIKAAKKALAKARDQLHAAVRERLKPPAKEAARLREADLAEDNAWGALHDLLRAWSRLPAGEPHAEAARALASTLFPDGLRFTHLAYREEWAQAEARLTKIVSEGLDKTLERLGAAPFLANLQAAHAAYGRLLGTTQAPSEPPPPPQPSRAVRAALDELAGALRGYVLAVAYAANTGNGRLGTSLLAAWERARSPRKAKKATPPRPAPTPTP